MRDGRTLTGPEIFEWLAHLVAHSVVGPVKGQEGRYHGLAYRDATKAIGLDAVRDATGYGDTSLAAGSRTRYRNELAALDRALAKWQHSRPVPRAAPRRDREPAHRHPEHLEGI